MKKELGKWLMDISKYFTTAVVLSSIFGGITETWKILTLGFITISASIITGLLLIRSSEKEEKQIRHMGAIVMFIFIDIVCVASLFYLWKERRDRQRKVRL